jgi:hypothetical protein
MFARTMQCEFQKSDIGLKILLADIQNLTMSIYVPTYVLVCQYCANVQPCGVDV